MFPIGNPAGKVREKTLHDNGQCAQYYRMGSTLLGQLFGVPVRVVVADGVQHGIRRGRDVFVRGRDIRAEAQRVVGLVGEHGIPVRLVVHIRDGFVFPLEDRGSAEHVLPDRLRMPRCFRKRTTKHEIVCVTVTQQLFHPCFQIPESPIWLVAKGKNDKAEKAMCWLRGWVEPETIKHEFLELIHYNEVSGTCGSKAPAEKDTGLPSKLAQFKDPSVYRPMRFMMVLYFVSYVVSIFPTRPFITKIMNEINLVDNQNGLLVRHATFRVKIVLMCR